LRQASTLRTELQAFRQQQAPLTEQNQQLQHERDDAMRQLTALRDDNERLNRNTSDLLKLRGEVGMLRRQTNELGTLVQTLQSTGRQGSSAANTPQGSAEPTHFPREAWTFAGFATPEAAIQSCLWAKTSGDRKTSEEAVTPEFRQKIQEYLKNKSPEERTAILENMLSKDINATGVQIQRKMVLADDQVVLQLHNDGMPEKVYSIVTMKQINGEWKISGVDRRTAP